MQKLVFQNADDVLSAGRIGESKVIRIFRTQSAQKAVWKEKLKAALVQDVSFLTKHQGEIEVFSCKAGNGLGNSIIIAKHKNKTLSHITVNFCDPETQAAGETFRLEIAGQDGLIEYDSDKNRPLFLNAGGCVTGLFEDTAPETGEQEQVMQTVDAILNRLEGKA